MYIPPFTVSAEAINLIAEISAQIERYAIRLEQEDGLRLRKANRIKTIHSSLAIEGNTLSEDEVRDIIDGKSVVAHQGAPLQKQIPNKVPNKVPNKLKKEFPDISDATWDVYRILKSNHSSSAEEIGIALGISSRMVRKHIASLREAGIIVRIGSNKTGHWEVVRKEEGV